jgi:hypothetical protein
MCAKSYFSNDRQLNLKGDVGCIFAIAQHIVFTMTAETGATSTATIVHDKLCNLGTTPHLTHPLRPRLFTFGDLQNNIIGLADIAFVKSVSNMATKERETKLIDVGWPLHKWQKE